MEPLAGELGSRRRFRARQTRPVLVISETALNDILPVVNVLPLTSRKPGRRIYPNEALLPGAAQLV